MSSCTSNSRSLPTGVRLRDAIPRNPLIVLVEEDRRIRRFLCTILKYATKAIVIEAVNPCTALSWAGKTGCPIDLLVSNIDLSPGKTGIHLARALAWNNPSMQIILMSFRNCPPSDIPSTWRFLSIPFPTSVFLDCVNELCCCVEWAPVACSGRRLCR